MLGNKSDAKIEIFNLGTGNGLSVMELITAFERATGVKVPYKIAPRRAGDIEQVWANPAYANEVLGWKATTSIDDTMRSAWAWQCKLRERGIM
jgi:UDP-glucose 4-epimerase